MSAAESCNVSKEIAKTKFVQQKEAKYTNVFMPMFHFIRVGYDDEHMTVVTSRFQRLASLRQAMLLPLF